jgi:hypothetical protein
MELSPNSKHIPVGSNGRCSFSNTSLGMTLTLAPRSHNAFSNLNEPMEHGIVGHPGSFCFSSPFAIADYIAQTSWHDLPRVLLSHTCLQEYLWSGENIEVPITRPEGGEWEPIKILLEGDWNSNNMNLLGRTPKITHSALLPSVCQNHVATGVLLVLGTNTTSNLNSYAPMTVETTRESAVQRGAVRPGMGGG